MIRLENVTREFIQGNTVVRALDNVSLAVPEGEFLSITGPSGSGKSTLLQLMGGIDTPTSGEVFVADRGLSTMTDRQLSALRRRDIGFVFQFFHLLPHLTAGENVALPLLLDGKKMKDVRMRVDLLLGLVGLEHRHDHRPDELSGGEMQRVAIARALAPDPAVLLADEPTGNLDSQTGTEILQLIMVFAKRRKQTVILVTHDQAAAATADRVVCMNDGRIVTDTCHVADARTGTLPSFTSVVAH